MPTHRRVSSRPQASSDLGAYAMILLVFAVICFATAFYFNLRNGSPQSFTFDPSDPEATATLEVKDKDTVFLVEVTQSTNGLRDNTDWSAVAIEVSSPEGDTIASFGDEFWTASGYDDGYWSEKKSRYDMKLTLPIPGEYVVGVEAESSPPSFSNPITARFTPKRGSATPFFTLGVLGMIAGVAAGYFANKEAVNSALSNVEFN